MQFCIFEDTAHVNFFPLVYFRPVYELRCGALSLREKIKAILPEGKLVLHCREHLVEIAREEYPDFSKNTLSDEDTWFINGRLLASDRLADLFKPKRPSEVVYHAGNEVAVAFVRKENIHRALKLFVVNGGAEMDIASRSFDGTLMHYPWDLVNHTSEEIANDYSIVKKLNRMKPVYVKKRAQFYGTFFLNENNILIGKESYVKAGAVLDAEKGPIILGKNVTVMSNAVIEGPAYVGDNSIIKIGAKIYHGTSIGVQCKVGGEVEASVIQSYSNKQHEGFLGHSYLGSWVNLGADTNTSDLKNTYGTIRVPLNGSMIDSGHQFVGLTMGDHSKSGINVMFDTGTVVGVSCNIYGATLPPKYLPSFSWGGEGNFTEYQLEKSLETARRAMARRNITMTEAYENLFRSIYLATANERNKGRSV